jgi:cytochrome c
MPVHSVFTAGIHAIPDHRAGWMSMHLLTAAFVLATAGAVPAHAADVAAGQAVFHAKCALCHSVTPGQNKVGPSLAGVVGRPAGQAPGYSYSSANKTSGKTWDAATLDVYLTNPRALVPGTKMAFAGLPDATDRANVIAYLSTVK